MNKLIVSMFLLSLACICSVPVSKSNSCELKHEIRATNETCHVCHIIVDTISYEVHHYNKTIHDITDLVKDLCKNIGGPIVSKECTFIIDNIQKIIDWIQQGSTPNIVCEHLGFCS
jgi:hypothetical protein